MSTQNHTHVSTGISGTNMMALTCILIVIKFVWVPQMSWWLALLPLWLPLGLLLLFVLVCATIAVLADLVGGR